MRKLVIITLLVGLMIATGSLNKIPVKAATTQEASVQEIAADQEPLNDTMQNSGTGSSTEGGSENNSTSEYFKVDVKTDYKAIAVTGIISLLAAFISAFLTLFVTKRKDVKHSALLLYCDLKSIESYLNNGNPKTNLRYNPSWQEAMVDCSFLSEKSVEWIYEFYDELYDYNYLYDKDETERKNNELGSYKAMKDKMFDMDKGAAEYNRIIQKLSKEAKLKKVNNNDPGNRDKTEKETEDNKGSV